MKFEKSLTFLAMLQKRLGEDLNYNLVLEDDEVSLILSVGKTSKRKFKNNKIQRIRFSAADLKKEMFVLANEIANIMKDLLVKNEETKNEIIE